MTPAPDFSLVPPPPKWGRAEALLRNGETSLLRPVPNVTHTHQAPRQPYSYIYPLLPFLSPSSSPFSSPPQSATEATKRQTRHGCLLVPPLVAHNTVDHRSVRPQVSPSGPSVFPSPKLLHRLTPALHHGFSTDEMAPTIIVTWPRASATRIHPGLQPLRLVSDPDRRPRSTCPSRSYARFDLASFV